MREWTIKPALPISGPPPQASPEKQASVPRLNHDEWCGVWRPPRCGEGLCRGPTCRCVRGVVVAGRCQVIRIVFLYVAMILIAVLLLRSGIVDAKSGRFPPHPAPTPYGTCQRPMPTTFTESAHQALMLDQTVQTHREIM